MPRASVSYSRCSFSGRSFGDHRISTPPTIIGLPWLLLPAGLAARPGRGSVTPRPGSPRQGRRVAGAAPSALALFVLTEELPQHVLQNAAVPIVFHLDRRVDAQSDRHLALLAGGLVDHEHQVH